MAKLEHRMFPLDRMLDLGRVLSAPAASLFYVDLGLRLISMMYCLLNLKYSDWLYSILQLTKTPWHEHLYGTNIRTHVF